HAGLNHRLKDALLPYATTTEQQRQTTVKVPGSFRPTVGRPHLHSQCNFAESLVETAPKSLHHSCRSELRVIPLLPVAQTMPSSHDALEDHLRLIPALSARVHHAG